MHGIVPVPHKEIELKLEFTQANLPSLKMIPIFQAIKSLPRTARQVSVYFDTDKQKLRQKGLMLRVRRQRGHYIQTIKASGDSAGFQRDEWETEIAGKQPDLSKASGTALEPLLRKKFRRRLKPLFETRVRRTVYPLVHNGNAIALSVDRGTIDTGKRSQPLCEIELELQRGTAVDLFDMARELSEALPVRLALKSKSERGYEIIDGTDELPVKAAAINLPASANARDAFRMIGFACLEQIVGNVPALAKGDPEGVHQMRVGLRRLRAPARELEVLANRVVAPVAKCRRSWRGMPVLSQELAERRNAALVRSQDAVQSARFRTLTIEVAAWLQSGLWTSPQDDLVADQGGIAAELFASDQLTRRWRKVRKKGRILVKLDARNRHKLRIQTKKLRYAVEFFAALFATKRARKRRKQFLPALQRLQDGLGDLNDIAVHEKRIAAVGIRRARATPSRVFAAGILTGREDARMEAVMAAAKEAYADLVEVKRFWR